MTEENRTYITHLKVTDVPWHRLTTAYGRGTEFPAHLAVLEQMRDLASVKESLYEPVSYTHLDVYKRQLQAHPMLRNAFLFPQLCDAVPHKRFIAAVIVHDPLPPISTYYFNIRAVSYTHLDVYKRQVCGGGARLPANRSQVQGSSAGLGGLPVSRIAPAVPERPPLGTL